VNEPGIVLADEPTGNLDVDAARQLMEVIQALAEDFNQAFLIVTHNPDVAALCERNLTIKEGTVIPAS
jgi:lipoprotein-releasing system ATP-binding protein